MKDMLIQACSADNMCALMLRGSIYNYPQISAVNKAGGFVLANLFQDVESKRNDGQMCTDKRAFYQFNPEHYAERADSADCFEHVTIARPGGNDTAIVWDKVPRDEQPQVAQRIQETYPGVEQVMFAEKNTDDTIRGQMAGGEFCGNATRSLGYILLNGENGEIDLEVSGSNTPVRVCVEDGCARLTSDINRSMDMIYTDQETGYDIVQMQGIAFVIMQKDDPMAQTILETNDQSARKDRIYNLLEKCDLAHKMPASGVMISDYRHDGSYKLDPFVYVRDVNSLIYETGCGSGSTATALLHSKELGSSIDKIAIEQPSGMQLYVSVDRDEHAFKKSSVDGPVTIAFDGRMYLSRSNNLTAHNQPK